jgi:hypothetical protein
MVRNTTYTKEVSMKSPWVCQVFASILGHLVVHNSS